MKNNEKLPLNSKSQSNDNLVFREVEVSDTPFLVSLMKQLGYPIDEPIMRDNIQNITQIPNQKAFVAVKSGKVVGCIAIAITHYFHRLGSFLRVIAMIVDEQERRSGIGISLMNIAEKLAIEKGCSHIELTSGIHREMLGSHEFYRSLGYVELSDKKKYFAKKLESNL